MPGRPPVLDPPSRRDRIAGPLQVGVFACAPLVAFAAVNVARGPSIGVLASLAGVLTVPPLFAMLLAGRRSRRRWWALADVWSMVVTVLLNWRTFGGLRAAPLDMRAAEHALASVIVVLLVLLAIRFGRAPAFREAALLITIAIALTSGFQFTRATTAAGPAALTVAPSATAEAGPRPDIVVILTDAYARADVLDRLYGFDNAPFIDALAERGVRTLSRAYAPYSMTIGSVASMFAMEYPVGDGVAVDASVERSLYRMIRGDNPVVASLTTAGYRYIHVESPWEGAACGASVDVCVRAGGIDPTLAVLIEDTPVAPLIYDSALRANARASLAQMERLRAIVSADADEPRFIFAHLFPPHPPLVLDGSCRVRVEPHLRGTSVGGPSFDQDLDERKAAYVEQVRCVNDRMLAVVDAVPDDAIVVITGDHGTASGGQLWRSLTTWTPTDIWERHATQAAVRLPERCPHPAPNAAVGDLLRAVVACVTGADLPALPGRLILLKPGETTMEGDPGVATTKAPAGT